MRPTSSSVRACRLRRHARSRRGRASSERGMAVFVVVLVIMSLTAVAMIAMRTSTANIEVAARYKQANQARYVSELGIQAVLGEVDKKGQAYIQGMTSPPAGMATPTCKYTPDVPTLPTLPKDCFKFSYQGVQSSYAGPHPFIDPGNPGARVPGGLGSVDASLPLQGNFVVEMTDKDEWPMPIAGYPVGGSTPLRFYTATLSGIGQIAPTGAYTAQNAHLVSIDTKRAHVVIGPLPAGL